MSNQNGKRCLSLTLDCDFTLLRKNCDASAAKSRLTTQDTEQRKELRWCRKML